MNLLGSVRCNNIKLLLSLGIFLIAIGGMLLLPKAFASPVPVKSIEITSSKLSYKDKEPGSYNIVKSAEWIEKGKARITFDLDTVMKAEDKYKDIIFVLDISGSMDGDKLNRVKQDSIDLINTLLSDSNNRGALITFETSSQLVLGLTNNKDELTSAINNLTTTGCTNYYQALVNVGEILKDYKKEENRDCIVLFLTDGYPNEDVPNEEGQYSYLKKAYPYLTINGIQYEMGSYVLDPIKRVSDSQFIADMTNLNNVLFEASVAPSTYNEFLITDYIDNDYFEIESVDSIVATTGSTKLEYEGTIPKVIWDIKNLRSGAKEKLTIDINLKKEYINKGGLYPTNKKEKVTSLIDKIKEDITSTNTPILSSHYQVIYDGNAPDGCSLEGEIPKTESKAVFEIVEKSSQKLICGDYQFKGWGVTTENVKIMSSDYFEMPSNDVMLKAIWANVSISKDIDGEVYVAPPSIIKKVNGIQQSEIWKYKSSITKVVFENSISDKEGAIETFDISDKKDESVIGHIVPNDDTTTYTAYIQGNEKIIANQDSSSLFASFSKLLSIEGLEYFDTSQVTNMTDMFRNCSSLTSLDLGTFDTGRVTTMLRMFYKCSNLVDINLSNFDTSKVTDMTDMFRNCSSLTRLDLNNFDTSKVTDMDGMFSECSSLTNLDLSSFDTSNVTRMGNLFYKCSNLVDINLSNFDTGKITVMSNMFYGCSSLTSLDLSSFDTSKVTTMVAMFSACRSLTVLDLSSFNTSNVINMKDMFYGDSGLLSLNLSGFDTSQVKVMSRMFLGCSSLTSLDVSSFDTSKVTTMVAMFMDCSNLTTLDLSSFNTSQVTSMAGMFRSCNRLTSLDLGGFDTSNVTDMSYMFIFCSGLTKLDVSGFDTSNVTNMESMFYYCMNLISLDVSNFNTSKVTNMEEMFHDCRSLTILDVSGFDTSQVTNMNSIFRACGSLKTINVTNFDTSNVTTMEGMFSGCNSLTSLDLSSFDTEKVRNMTSMFYGCKGLNTLDLSNFDTSQVTSMTSMFSNCGSLITLDLSNFDTSKVTSMYGMFDGCSNLTTLDLGNFNTSKVTTMYWMFNGCSKLITSITIMNSTSYYRMFSNAATQNGAKIIVNYTVETSDLVDEMIATKSSNSNVIKGELVSSS